MSQNHPRHFPKTTFPKNPTFDKSQAKKNANLPKPRWNIPPHKRSKKLQNIGQRLSIFEDVTPVDANL